jgi:DNA-directed RNA polymerase specialized sigma24 family protein
VRAWVLGIVHNSAIDALRRMRIEDVRTCHDERLAELIPTHELTETEVVRRRDARQVRDALRGLPPAQRQVIELAYFGGLTHRRIAELLDLPTGTVKGRIRLGLEKMSAVLAPEVEPRFPQLAAVESVSEVIPARAGGPDRPGSGRDSRRADRGRRIGTEASDARQSA